MMLRLNLAFVLLADILCDFSAYALEAASRDLVSIEEDCLLVSANGDDDRTSCLSPPSFEYRFAREFSPRIKFSGAVGDLPGLSSRDLNRPRVLSSSADDHAAIWRYVTDVQLRMSLDGPWAIGIGTHRGVVSPHRNGSQRLQGLLLEGAWQQLAASLSFRDERLSTELYLGQGEGEFQSQDVAGYVGVSGSAQLTQGVHFIVGASWDGDNRGSEQIYLLRKLSAESPDRPKFRTERLLMALAVDGMLPAARGLEVTALWQQTKYLDSSSSASTDLAITNYPTQIDGYFGPLFFEVEGQLNTSLRSIYEVNSTYRILDAIVMGASTARANVSLGQAKIFRSCASYEANLCVDSGAVGADLSQTAWSFGIGYDWQRTIRIQLEYAEISFDQLYEYPHFDSGKGAGVRNQALLNLGVNARWQF